MNKLTQFFKNNEIFDLFKGNKKILLNLYKSQILTPDKSHFIKENNYDNWIFFLHEIKSFLSEEEIQNIQKDFSSTDKKF